MQYEEFIGYSEHGSQGFYSLLSFYAINVLQDFRNQ